MEVSHKNWHNSRIFHRQKFTFFKNKMWDFSLTQTHLDITHQVFFVLLCKWINSFCNKRYCLLEYIYVTTILLFWGWFSLGQIQPGKLLLSSIASAWLAWKQDCRPLSQPSGIKKAPKPREDRGISVCAPVFWVWLGIDRFHLGL